MSHDELAARVLKNPFDAREGDWRAAAERLLAAGRGESAFLARLLARAAIEGASLRELTSARSLPERALERLECSRADVGRILGAWLRCMAELEGLAGTSLSLQRVRAAAWSTCFGESLERTLRFERVIREHDVLITGETGTGKEAVARAIAEGTLGHGDGGRGPFSALNIAAVPETLIESELFGHVRGAFTGAQRARAGHIRSAAGGVLLLDEVGDLPVTAQSKLLRVMETDMVTPVGSDATHAADVRYVTATHQDLGQMVRAGRFRADLYQRLAGNVIHLPALRERPEDVLEIGTRFAARYLNEGAPEWKRVNQWLSSREVGSHAWPGNVRELQNCLRNVLLGVDAGVRPSADVTPDLHEALPAFVRDASASLARVESWYLLRAFDRAGRNYAQAARVLGVDRATVRRKLRALGA
jgi:DNA-binding NtrC family response regulator